MEIKGGRHCDSTRTDADAALFGGGDRPMAFWLAVACANHVRRGRAGGFMQVCHGRAAPLRRIAPLDGVAYYSPGLIMGEKDGFQAFTAIGTVKPGAPYQVAMAPGFTPFRRDVDWEGVREVRLASLKNRLGFTRDRHWGYSLRLGLIEISEADFAILAEAMICPPSHKDAVKPDTPAPYYRMAGDLL